MSALNNSQLIGDRLALWFALLSPLLGALLGWLSVFLLTR